MTETLWTDPFTVIKRKEEKTEKKKPTIRWNSPQSEFFWDTNGPKDAFKAHPLALSSITYKSSSK